MKSHHLVSMNPRDPFHKTDSGAYHLIFCHTRPAVITVGVPLACTRLPARQTSTLAEPRRARGVGNIFPFQDRELG